MELWTAAELDEIISQASTLSSMALLKNIRILAWSHSFDKFKPISKHV